VSFHESSDVCVDFGRLMVACELREPNSQLRESIPSAKHSSSGRRLVPVVGNNKNFRSLQNAISPDLNFT
jgi:hypothetical protein